MMSRHFGTFPRLKTSQLHWAPSHSKSVSLCSDVTSCSAIYAHCLFSLKQLVQNFFSVFSTASRLIFKHILGLPLSLLFTLSSPLPSVFPYMRLQSLDHLRDSLLASLQQLHIPLALGSSELCISTYFLCFCFGRSSMFIHTGRLIFQFPAYWDGHLQILGEKTFEYKLAFLASFPLQGQWFMFVTQSCLSYPMFISMFTSSMFI